MTTCRRENDGSAARSMSSTHGGEASARYPPEALDLLVDQQLADGRLGSRGAALVPLHPASTGRLAGLYTTERSTP
jgi:hypothetical protein